MLRYLVDIVRIHTVKQIHLQLESRYPHLIRPVSGYLAKDTDGLVGGIPLDGIAYRTLYCITGGSATDGVYTQSVLYSSA